MLDSILKPSLFILSFVLIMACSASQVSMSSDDVNMEAISKEVGDAVIEGNYEKALALTLPYAEGNDPEALFTVGMMMLEWIGDPAARSEPTFTSEDALIYVKKAADLGVLQAAGLLRAGYQFGRYTLPKDEALAKCWRMVERGQRLASECG